MRTLTPPSRGAERSKPSPRTRHGAAPHVAAPERRARLGLVEGNDLLGLGALESDLVDRHEERELGLLALLLDARHDVLGGAGALQLLPVELLRLLQVTSYKLQATAYKLQVTTHKSRVTSYFCPLLRRLDYVPLLLGPLL